MGVTETVCNTPLVPCDDARHKKMFELYEQHCNLLQPGAPMYWGDGDELVDADEVTEAKDVEVASCAEGF